MRTIARHTFKKVIISPQGRIYRDVLYPQRQHLQALLQYVDAEAPYVYNEWLSVLAGTRYRMPKDLKEIIIILNTSITILMVTRALLRSVNTDSLRDMIKYRFISLSKGMK